MCRPTLCDSSQRPAWRHARSSADACPLPPRSYNDHLSMPVPGAPEPERHSAAAAPVHAVIVQPAAAAAVATVPTDAPAKAAPAAKPDHSAAELRALQQKLVNNVHRCRL